MSLVWLKPFTFVILAWPFALTFCLYLVNIYKILWRFSGFEEIFRIIFGGFAAFLATIVAQKGVFSRSSLDLSVYIFIYFFTIFLIIIHRYIIKYIAIKKSANKSVNQNDYDYGNIMIIGAGSAAESVIKNSKYKIKCVIDDNKEKRGQYISGIHVVGGREMILSAAEKYNIDTIIFAIPSCDNKNKTHILNICQQTKCDLKIVPSIYELNDVDEITSSITLVLIVAFLTIQPSSVNSLPYKRSAVPLFSKMLNSMRLS